MSFTATIIANVPNKPKSSIYPVYLVCFVNPSRDNVYISKLVNETFRYCLTLLLNTREREEETRLKKAVSIFALSSEKTVFSFRRSK
ncbi:hypothetical protein NQ317_003802 [Molorchus minor]|uniref:Uncharacterized protein n=1 Tax=Molorchus minor TaxID=1323400 RepID=A0ABQ9ISK0_9CUCU|nr:hypothetical protein NQ317_003802 [Molorchus minor]